MSEKEPTVHPTRGIKSSHRERVFYHFYGYDTNGALVVQMRNGILPASHETNAGIRVDLPQDGDIGLLAVATERGSQLKVDLKYTNIISAQLRDIEYEVDNRIVTLRSLQIKFDSTHKTDEIIALHHEEAHVGQDDGPPPIP